MMMTAIIPAASLDKSSFSFTVGLLTDLTVGVATDFSRLLFAFWMLAASVLCTLAIVALDVAVAE